MKNIILNLSKTPLAQIKNNYFNNVDHNKIFLEMNQFLKELKDFNSINPYITIVSVKADNNSNGGLRNTVIPIHFNIEEKNSFFKAEDIYYQDTLDHSKIILFNNNSFSVLINDKKNNSSYVVLGSYHSGFRIEYFEEKKKKNVLSVFQGDNRSFLNDKNDLEISNSVNFSKNNIIQNITKITDYNNNSFNITFNEKKSQIRHAKVVNGNIEEVMLSENTWFVLSENFQNKYRGRAGLTLTEFIEISDHIKPKYDLNFLEFDESPWEFLPVDTILEVIKEALNVNKNNFYVIPEHIINKMNSICEEVVHNDTVKESEVIYKSLSFLECDSIDPNKIEYPNTSLETIKNIYTDLMNDLTRQRKIVYKKQPKNKPI